MAGFIPCLLQRLPKLVFAVRFCALFALLSLGGWVRKGVYFGILAFICIRNTDKLTFVCFIFKSSKALSDQGWIIPFLAKN